MHDEHCYICDKEIQFYPDAILNFDNVKGRYVHKRCVPKDKRKYYWVCFDPDRINYAPKRSGEIISYRIRENDGDFYSLAEILHEVNREFSEEHIPYDENDWKESWEEVVWGFCFKPEFFEAPSTEHIAVTSALEVDREEVLRSIEAYGLKKLATQIKEKHRGEL